MTPERKALLDEVYGKMFHMSVNDRAELMHAAMCANLGHCHRIHWPVPEQQFVYDSLSKLLRG